MNWLTFSGAALMCVAVFVGAIGLMLGVSVSSRGAGDVFNLSLAHQQNLFMGFAAVGWLSGVILLGFGALLPDAPKPLPKKHSVIGTPASGRLIAKRAEQRNAEETDEYIDSLG